MLDNHKTKFSRFRHDLFKIYRVQNLYLLELILIFTAAFITFFLEKNNSDSTIKNFGDGLWWSIGTVTSVGFGDKVPVTAGGRVVGVILAFSGLILVGITISIFALYFSRSRDEYNQKKTHSYLAEIEAEIEELKKTVGYLVKK